MVSWEPLLAAAPDSLILVSSNGFDVTKWRKDAPEVVVGKGARVALEEKEEGALVLIPVAALGRVCVSWERVVDVDLQQSATRQPKLLIVAAHALSHSCH